MMDLIMLATLLGSIALVWLLLCWCSDQVEAES